MGYCNVDFQRPEDIRASITLRGEAPAVLPVPDTVRSACTSLSSVSTADMIRLGQTTTDLLRGQYRRVHADKAILPSFWTKRKAINSVVTNWAGFYEQIVLEGCEHVSHCPVFMSNMPAVMPGAVIYKSDKNTLNIMAVQGKRVFVDELIKQGAVERINI